MIWGAGGLVLLAVVTVVVLPDVVVREPSATDRGGRIDVADMDVAAGDVTGESAELAVTVWLRNRGGRTDNLSLTVRAVGSSGLIADVNETDVDQIRGDRDVRVERSVTVPREGSYRLEAMLFRDGVRTDTTSTSVSGLSALGPDYARSPVTFHGFPGLPTVQYRIDATTGSTVSMEVGAFVTNRGSQPRSGSRLVVRARQQDSGIIADEGRVDVGRLRSGETALPTAMLSVPDGYNYYLDAYLWRDGVLVDTATGAANLDPSRTITPNVTRESVELEVGDFETDRRRFDESGFRQQRATNDTAARGGEGQPGFAVLVAVVAILATVALAVRRQR